MRICFRTRSGTLEIGFGTKCFKNLLLPHPDPIPFCRAWPSLPFLPLLLPSLLLPRCDLHPHTRCHPHPAALPSRSLLIANGTTHNNRSVVINTVNRSVVFKHGPRPRPQAPSSSSSSSVTVNLYSVVCLYVSPGPSNAKPRYVFVVHVQDGGEMVERWCRDSAEMVQRNQKRR